MKILFTARDIGAGTQIYPIIKYFQTNTSYQIQVLASGPAYHYFLEKLLPTLKFETLIETGLANISPPENQVNELIKEAKVHLTSIQPDCIIAGLTTIDLGVDEAILYVGKKLFHLPCFQFLDSCGTFNQLKEGHPDLYFGINQNAIKFKYKGAKAPIKIVGSPKHFVYSKLDATQLKIETRKKYGLKESTKLIGYFGQHPAIPGHTENFHALVEAIRLLGTGHDLKLLFCPHPAYKTLFEPYTAYLEKNEISYIEDTSTLVEARLCACDVIATCFSTVGIDHNYLNAYASKPLGNLIYLSVENSLKTHLENSFGYQKVPASELGLGKTVESGTEIKANISNFEEASKIYFNHAKFLKLTDRPSKNIAQIIHSKLNSSIARSL